MKFEKDIEYFRDYPAPLMELLQEKHFTPINHTIPFYSPMFYFLARALCCEQVLEIGTAEGYSSFYLAHAVKDNGARFGMTGNHFYGIDIAQTERVQETLVSLGLPATIIKMDSMDLTPDTFKGIVFDAIFQDGSHHTENVVHEFKTLWPQLKGKGKGYWLAHDCLPSRHPEVGEGFKEIKRMIDSGEVKAEYIQLVDIWGLALIRKLED